MKSRQQSEDSFGAGRMALAQRTGIQRPDTGPSWGLSESSVCYNVEKTTRAEGGPEQALPGTREPMVRVSLITAMVISRQ